MEPLSPHKQTPTTEIAEKAKTLSALSILLTGLFIGSLFVDLVQLATGQGFSGRAVKTHNVLETADKTWVAYSDPKVIVEVVTDKSCTECKADDALVWLRRVVPTLEATEIAHDSDSGKALIDRFHITTLPAFVFSQSIARTDFYTQASSLFKQQGNRFFFDMNEIGLPIGKYLKTPETEESTISIGPKDAKVKIVEFSDFQCSFCKTFHHDLMKTIETYDGQILFVYKHLPLSIHAQANNAANAAECANEQGKFEVYADYLFAKQSEWANAKNTQKFKDYAWYLRLDGRAFAKCFDSKKYQERINGNKDEAAEFSITGTPGTFVNGTFMSGAVSTDDLKKVIEQELAK